MTFSSVVFMMYSLITEWSHRILILFMPKIYLSTAWFFSPSLSHALFLTVQCTFWGWGKIFFYDCLCVIHDKMTPWCIRGTTSINQKKTYSGHSTIPCMNLENKILVFLFSWVYFFSTTCHGKRYKRWFCTYTVQRILNRLLLCNYPRFLNLCFKSQRLFLS